LLSSKLHQRTS